MNFFLRRYNEEYFFLISRIDFSKTGVETNCIQNCLAVCVNIKFYKFENFNDKNIVLYNLTTFNLHKLYIDDHNQLYNNLYETKNICLV